MARRRLNRGFFKALIRRVRYFYLRLILLPDSPHRVSLGLAVGIFVGLTPTVPIQTILALFLAWILRGSKIAACLGIWITNPVTIPPFYTAMFFVGRALTPFGGQAHMLKRAWQTKNLLDMGTDIGLAILFGGIILGVVCAPLTYVLAYKYVARLQAWERAKMRKRFAVATENTR